MLTKSDGQNAPDTLVVGFEDAWRVDHNDVTVAT